MTAADIPRCRRLGVIAIVQPPESSQTSLWKSFSDAGGRLAFGSNWPVVALNPWESIQSVVTRGTAEGKPGSAAAPEQRLTVAQAIEAYTLGAAFAGHHEKTEGSLEVGKLADLIIVSKNIFDIDSRKISQTRTLTTIVGGRLVYQAAAN